MLTRTKWKNLREVQTSKTTTPDIPIPDISPKDSSGHSISDAFNFSDEEVDSSGSTTSLIPTSGSVTEEIDDTGSKDQPLPVQLIPVQPIPEVQPTFNMALTKEDMEGLLKNMDIRKATGFQPAAFSGSGSESASDFMNQFVEYSKLTGLKGEDQIVVFNLLLRGLAKYWFAALSDNDKANFNIIKQKFQDAFLSPSKNWLVTQRLEARKLLSGEKVENYVSDILEMANNVKMSENEQRAALIRGLSPAMRAQLITHNPQTLADTIERIYLSETALTLQKQDNVSVIDTITSCQISNINSTVSELANQLSSITDQIKSSRTIPNHFNQDRVMGIYGRPMNYPDAYEGRPPPRQQFLRNNNNQQYQQMPRMPYYEGCFTCGRKNHYNRDCFYRKMDAGNGTTRRGDDSTRRGDGPGPRRQQYFNNRDSRGSPSTQFGRQLPKN